MLGARVILYGLLLISAVFAVWIFAGLQSSADLTAYDEYMAAPAGINDGETVTVHHLGVSTLLISDGTTALMTDGFASRPGLLSVLLGLSIEPDLTAIEAALKKASVTELAAVMTVHSHYDHAMDAPEVARRTGAILVGSESTANVGRGWGLPEGRIRVAEPGVAMRFGAFRVTFVPSKHFPLRFGADTIGQEISQPLEPPVAAMDYLEGGSYSILVEHPVGAMLIHASAGFVEGALDAYTADVVLLGAAGMGTESAQYLDAYYREVVEAVGATRIFPIHYDDFTIAADKPVRSMPNLVDDIDRSMHYLIGRADADPTVEFAMLPLWQPVSVFESRAP